MRPRSHPRHDRPPQPPRAATLPLVVAALVLPAAVAWIFSPYLGVLVTALAAVVLVVVAVGWSQ